MTKWFGWLCHCWVFNSCENSYRTIQLWPYCVTIDKKFNLYKGTGSFTTWNNLTRIRVLEQRSFCRKGNTEHCINIPTKALCSTRWILLFALGILYIHSVDSNVVLQFNVVNLSTIYVDYSLFKATQYSQVIINLLCILSRQGSQGNMSWCSWEMPQRLFNKGHTTRAGQ